MVSGVDWLPRGKAKCRWVTRRWGRKANGWGGMSTVVVLGPVKLLGEHIFANPDRYSTWISIPLIVFNAVLWLHLKKDN